MDQNYIQNILSSMPGVNFVFENINCVSRPPFLTMEKLVA